MMTKSTKEFEEVKITWNQINDIRFDYENDLRMSFKYKLVECLEKVKNDFESYLSADFSIKKTKFMWTAFFNSFRIELGIAEPNANNKHEFELLIDRGNRLVYRIVVFPNCEIYFPKIVLYREQPKTLDLLKDDLKKITNENLKIEEYKKIVKEGECIFCYYRSDNPKPAYHKKLKRYATFRDILKKLLND